MSLQKTIFIVGGSSGAKIATNIFKQTHPNHDIYYVECYSNDIVDNKIYNTLSESLDDLKLSSVDYFIATGNNLIRQEHYELIKNYTNKEDNFKSSNDSDKVLSLIHI